MAGQEPKCSTNKERSILLLGDLGELAEVENEDLHQLPAFFSFKLTVPAGEWSKASEVAEDYLCYILNLICNLLDNYQDQPLHILN